MSTTVVKAGNLHEMRQSAFSIGGLGLFLCSRPYNGMGCFCGQGAITQDSPNSGRCERKKDRNVVLITRRIYSPGKRDIGCNF